MTPRTADLEAWLDACNARETFLGIDDWLAQQSPNIVDPTEAAILNDSIRSANDAFRTFIRPLAIHVLGDWAIDDKAANRNGRGWTARVSRNGQTVTFVDTLYAMGPNESTTRKEHKVDFTGRSVK